VLPLEEVLASLHAAEARRSPRTVPSPGLV
jgi:hypothetical protein